MRATDGGHQNSSAHWRSYGNDPLPTGAEALDEPFAAFPSWFMRVTCERCGQERMFNEAHASVAQRAMLLRDILDKMRPEEGCGGRAGKGRRSCSAASRASAAARCGRSCCWAWLISGLRSAAHPGRRVSRVAQVPLCYLGQERPYLVGLHRHVWVVQQAVKFINPSGVFGVRQFDLQSRGPHPPKTDT
jgi:hypothetical protein